jgi:flagellar motor switch protein FliG
LTIALKSAPDSLRDKFFQNMSKRAADMLRDDLREQGPIRVSKVEEEQKRIVQIARRLAEAGQFSLSGLANEDYV